MLGSVRASAAPSLASIAPDGSGCSALAWQYETSTTGTAATLSSFIAPLVSSIVARKAS